MEPSSDFVTSYLSQHFNPMTVSNADGCSTELVIKPKWNGFDFVGLAPQLFEYSVPPNIRKEALSVFFGAVYAPVEKRKRENTLVWSKETRFGR